MFVAEPNRVYPEKSGVYNRLFHWPTIVLWSKILEIGTWSSSDIAYSYKFSSCDSVLSEEVKRNRNHRVFFSSFPLKKTKHYSQIYRFVIGRQRYSENYDVKKESPVARTQPGLPTPAVSLSQVALPSTHAPYYIKKNMHSLFVIQFCLYLIFWINKQCWFFRPDLWKLITRTKIYKYTSIILTNISVKLVVYSW